MKYCSFNSSPRTVRFVATSIAISLCLTPQASLAIFPVFDAANEIHFLSQISHQVEQIKQFATQVSQGKSNLQGYSTAGQWAQIHQRLKNLQTIILSAKKNSKITGDVADQQMKQLDQEMSNVDKMEQLANSSKGNLQAQQASARLQAEIIAQLQEIRMLQIAQIKQTQLDQENAMKRLHAPAIDPTSDK